MALWPHFSSLASEEAPLCVRGTAERALGPGWPPGAKLASLLPSSAPHTLVLPGWEMWGTPSLTASCISLLAGRSSLLPKVRPLLRHSSPGQVSRSGSNTPKRAPVWSPTSPLSKRQTNKKRQSPSTYLYEAKVKIKNFSQLTVQRRRSHLEISW